MSLQITAPANAKLGYGCDPDTGVRLGLALSEEPAGIDQVGSPTGLFATCQYADTVQELFQSFNLDASVSYDWLFGSADLRVDLLNSTSASSHTLTGCFYSRVQGPVQLIKGVPKLSQQSAALLKKDPAKFYDAYGSHYIDGFTRGGELYGFFSLEVNDLQDKQSLKASLNVGGFGGSLTSDVATQLQSQLSKYSVQVRICTTNGPANLTPCTFDQIFTMWQQFPSMVNANPQILGVILSPYLELAPDDAMPPEKTEQRAADMNTLLSFFMTFKGFAAELDRAIIDPDLFVPASSSDDFTKLRNQCTAGIENIKKAIAEVRQYKALPADISTVTPSDSLRVQIISDLGKMISVSAKDEVPTDTGIAVEAGRAIQFIVGEPSAGFPQRWTVAVNQPSVGWTDAAGYPNRTEANQSVGALFYSGAVFGRLVGAIGDSDPLEYIDIGLGTTCVAKTSGRLRLICNDSRTASGKGYDDNDGSIAVNVRYRK